LYILQKRNLIINLGLRRTVILKIG